MSEQRYSPPTPHYQHKENGKALNGFTSTVKMCARDIGWKNSLTLIVFVYIHAASNVTSLGKKKTFSLSIPREAQWKICLHHLT